LLNNYILALKSGLGITNLSDEFDCMYITAGETSESSLRNLVRDANHATLVNAPSFVPYQGFKGDAISSYVNTNFNPTAHGSRYSINSAVHGHYIRNLPTVNHYSGQYPSRNYLSINSIGSYCYTPVNCAVQDNVPGIGIGMIMGVRRDNANVITYYNKNETSNTEASTTIPNNNFFLGARDNNGVPDSYGNCEQSFFFMSSGLAKVKLDIITDAFEAYMDAHGKGVI